MKITIEMIQKLRQIIPAGIIDCKQALEKTEGNIEKAIEVLKKTGMNKSIQKKEKIAREGLTDVAIKGNKAILFELNSETDFVARNEIFLVLYNKLSQILLDTDVSIKTLEDFLNFKWNQTQTIQNLISETASILKEKIILNRIKIFFKTDQESFGFYKHQGGKISALVHLTNTNQEVQRYLPIHIVGCNSKFLSKKTVDSLFLQQQKNKILKKISKEQTEKSLTEELKDKMVISHLNQILSEICLLEQAFYIEPTQTISQYLTKQKTNVIDFVRFQVGEE